jgi:hypothetical protein
MLRIGKRVQPLATAAADVTEFPVALIAQFEASGNTVDPPGHDPRNGWKPTGSRQTAAYLHIGIPEGGSFE